MQQEQPFRIAVHSDRVCRLKDNTYAALEEIDIRNDTYTAFEGLGPEQRWPAATITGKMDSCHRTALDIEALVGVYGYVGPQAYAYIGPQAATEKPEAANPGLTPCSSDYYAPTQRLSIIRYAVPRSRETIDDDIGHAYTVGRKLDRMAHSLECRQRHRVLHEAPFVLPGVESHADLFATRRATPDGWDKQRELERLWKAIERHVQEKSATGRGLQIAFMGVDVVTDYSSLVGLAQVVPEATMVFLADSSLHLPFSFLARDFITAQPSRMVAAKLELFVPWLHNLNEAKRNWSRGGKEVVRAKYHPLKQRFHPARTTYETSDDFSMLKLAEGDMSQETEA